MTGAILHCAAKEWRIRLRDRWALILWLMIPLTIGGMITAMSGGDQPQPVAHLMVVDEDDSMISGLLLGALEQVPEGQLVQAEKVSRSDGEARIHSGEASALLILPEGFGDAVLKEQPAAMELITNPAQRILPGILEEFISLVPDGVFYLHRIFGEELKIISQQIDSSPEGGTEVFPDTTIAELSVSINHGFETLATYLDPMALELKEPTAAEEDNGPGLNYALLFFPSFVFMGLLFAAQSLSGTFWEERDAGTLRRTLVSPLSLSEIFLGKLLAGAALVGLLSAVMTTIGFLYHGISLIHWLPTVLWLTLSGTVVFGLMSLIQLLAPTRKAATLITSILVFPLMMVGGAFFPFEALPGWLKTIGVWAPNGYMLERLKAYLIYDGGLSALLSSLPLSLGMALVLWALCAWRIRAFAGRSE